MFGCFDAIENGKGLKFWIWGNVFMKISCLSTLLLVSCVVIIVTDMKNKGFLWTGVNCR